MLEEKRTSVVTPIAMLFKYACFVGRAGSCGLPKHHFTSPYTESAIPVKQQSPRIRTLSHLDLHTLLVCSCAICVASSSPPLMRRCSSALSVWQLRIAPRERPKRSVATGIVHRLKRSPTPTSRGLDPMHASQTWTLRAVTAPVNVMSTADLLRH